MKRLDKEQWEPVIQRLFQLQETEAELHRIREAWSFDWQSHGDAAVLNYNVLKDRTKCVCELFCSSYAQPGWLCLCSPYATCARNYRPDKTYVFVFSSWFRRLIAPSTAVYEWTPALAAFIRSSRMQGHRIVPLGHSAGAAAMYVFVFFLPCSRYNETLHDALWPRASIYDQRHISIPFFSRRLSATNATCLRMLTTKEIPPSTFAAMVLIEATMVTREVFNSELEDRMSAMDFAVAATSSRRDVWPSRDEAFRYFKKRIPWMVWDERVILLLTVSPLRSQLFLFFHISVSV